MKKIIFFVLCAIPLYGKTSFTLGVSAGAMYQSGVFQGVNQNSGGGSFESKRNPYGVPAYLGALHFGIRHMQGCIYLGAHLYYALNTFNKIIYKNVTTPLVQDSVSLKTKGAPGCAFHVGYQVKDVTPYVSIGIEYAQRELTYKATNLQSDFSKNHRKPIMVLGVGMMGNIHEKFTLSFEAQRKQGQEFDVQIPISSGYPSLSNHRLKVGTSHWAIVATLTYEIPLDTGRREVSLPTVKNEVLLPNVIKHPNSRYELPLSKITKKTNDKNAGPLPRARKKPPVEKKPHKNKEKTTYYKLT
jgi:opacity protein-like surface antigen